MSKPGRAGSWVWDPLPLWWWRQDGHGLIWKQQHYRGQRQGLPVKERAAAPKVEAGGGELLGCHSGVPGQSDTRNGICVSFLVSGKGHLRNSSLGKEEGLAPASRCRSHLWSHFGEINECLWTVVCNRSRSRWCLSAVKYSLDADFEHGPKEAPNGT